MKRLILVLLLVAGGAPLLAQGMCPSHHPLWSESHPYTSADMEELTDNVRTVCEDSVSVATTWDFASGKLGVPKGTALPATCTVGQVFFDTDATAGQNVFGCTATNTWTLQSGGATNTPMNSWSYQNEAWISADIETSAALVFDPPVFWATSGTGAANARNSSDAEAGHPGIIEQQTGTATNGKAAVQSNATFILFGGGTWTYYAVVRIPTLSDGTNRFVYRAGFTENTAGDSTDGAYLRYSDSLSSGAWECVARNNGSETATSTAVTVVANTWYLLKIIVNAAGSNVNCTVNGAGSTDVASNIPTSAGRSTGFGASINKTLGTTSRYADMDMFAVNWLATSSR